MIIPAGGVEFLAVTGGTRIAHLQVSSAGWISVTQLGNTTPVNQSLPSAYPA
jgi:hypothetical protein